MRDNMLLALIAVFVPFSLISIGGGSAIIAGVQHEAVGVHHWVTAREFLDLFAISRAAPGPGTMIATLIGWKAAGWAGAIVATLAIFLPSCLLCYIITRWSNSHREKKWHRALREGLAPIGVGLTIAGAISIFRLSDGGVFAAGISVASAALMVLLPRVPTLAVLALGGLAAYLAQYCT